MLMLRVGVHVPVAGLYSSALEKIGHEPFTQVPSPPDTSTSPWGSSVAGWNMRAAVMLPVAAPGPAAGLQSSAPLAPAPAPPQPTPTAPRALCRTVAPPP